MRSIRLFWRANRVFIELLAPAFMICVAMVLLIVVLTFKEEIDVIANEAARVVLFKLFIND